MSKKNNTKKYIALAGILFLFPLVWLLAFGVFSKHNFNTMKYYGPLSDFEGDDTTDYTLPSFAFINQNGKTVTLDSLRGKVWLAAFYSLNDEHAAKITERLLNINWKYRDQPDIKIVVFSTDCDYDTPETIRAYTEQNTKYNSFPDKWEFLTGNQEAMQSYIRNGFLIKDVNNESIFRLIDEKGQIRGLYGNTEYHMLDAIEDIALLKKETDLRKYNERKAAEKNR